MNVIETIPGDINFHLFEELPFGLYCSKSICLRQEVDLNRKSLHKCFLILENETPLARAALYCNSDLHFNGQPAGCIGNYECVENNSVSLLLFEALFAEAKRLKLGYLIGPMNGSTWDGYRFNTYREHKVFFTEPYHHLYYNLQFVQAGFDVIANYISSISECALFVEKQENFSEKILSGQLSVRNIDLDNYERELERLYDFCLLAFAGNFLYTPVSLEYFKQKYRLPKGLMNAEFIKIAEDAKGNIVGFMFCLEDIYGDPGETLIIKTIARHPDPQWKGIITTLGNMVYKKACEEGFKNIIHAFMHINNASVKVSGKFEGKILTAYALYGRSV